MKGRESTTLNPTLSLWCSVSKLIDWVAYFFDILYTYENLFLKQILFWGPTNIFDTLDVTCPCFLPNMTPVPNSIFCMWFFAHHALHFFLVLSSTFSFVFELFFAICISGFVCHYIISIHINLWTWCGHDTDTGLPPRKPRFDKSWFYIRDCHPVSPAYMGLHLVWGLTGARPRMLNILHMLSNMCVFAYIVCILYLYY